MTSTYDPDNIFAKILRGEIPSTRVYEDDGVIAFMDAMPQAEGHTLVVPKAASRNLLDADPAAGELFTDRHVGENHGSEQDSRPRAENNGWTTLP